MENEPEVVELDIHELEGLLERIEATLGEEVATPFRQLLDCHVQLVEAVHRKDISIRTLREILFGKKTERSRDVLGTDRSSSADDPNPSLEDGEPATTPSHNGDKKEDNDPGPRRRRKGHGRNGADAYWGCSKVVFVVTCAGSCSPPNRPRTWARKNTTLLPPV